MNSKWYHRFITFAIVAILLTFAAFSVEIWRVNASFQETLQIDTSTAYEREHHL